jgi:hypothetical protein
MCHIGQEFMLLGSLQHGSCTIQPTKIAFSQYELMDMVTRCHINRLNQFAGFLVTNIRAARDNPQLLRLLQSLDEIAYSGLPLPQDEEKWAYSQGLQLKVHFYIPDQGYSDPSSTEHIWKYGVWCHASFYRRPCCASPVRGSRLQVLSCRATNAIRINVLPID